MSECLSHLQSCVSYCRLFVKTLIFFTIEYNRETYAVLTDEFEKYPKLWYPKHGFYYINLKKYNAWFMTIVY